MAQFALKVNSAQLLALHFISRIPYVIVTIENEGLALSQTGKV